MISDRLVQGLMPSARSSGIVAKGCEPCIVLTRIALRLHKPVQQADRCRRHLTSSSSSSGIGSGARQEEGQRQKRAYEYYRRSSRGTGERNVRVASYAFAAVIGAVGATYASVPLYKMFCQATGFGGTTQRVTLGKETSNISDQLWEKLVSLSNLPSDLLPQKGQKPHGTGRTWTDEAAAAKLASLKPVPNARLLTIHFDSTVGDVMPWSFTPTQQNVKVVPGETALSFFTATNHHPTKAITGVATYNVHPSRAGLYFNKIQCFCFEEQRLLPGETVDMPVFFYIDPDYVQDPQLGKVFNITLSYTFFQTDMDDDDTHDDVHDAQQNAP